MRKFAVIGLGSFGLAVVETLTKRGAEVLAIDKDLNKVEKAKDLGAIARQFDCSDEEALKESGIKDVDVAVVGIGDIEVKNVLDSIFVTAALSELGIKQIVARANDALHARNLKKAGATKVLFLAKEMGIRVANSIFYPGIFEYFELAPGYDLTEVQVTQRRFLGKKLNAINFERDFGISVILVRPVLEKGEKDEPKNEEKEVEFGEAIVRFSPLFFNYILKRGDLLAVLGDKNKIEAFEKAIVEEKK